MSSICPTVTPTTLDPHEYREQIERVSGISPRLQLDFMDGQFASPASLNIAQAWWPEGVQIDIHLMYQRPLEYIETLVSLKPSLIIVHAESDGDLLGMITHLQGLGIKAGIAILQPTTVESVKELIALSDHVLIFAGSLGTFGGHADLTQLKKVAEIRAINPRIEIGWDGGANETNVSQLATGGIDVINVGSAIQKNEHPLEAYQHLCHLID